MSFAHFSADCGAHHDLVRDFGGPRPEIVVLCGSTRFYDQFQQANYELTMAGDIVLSVGFYPHAPQAHGEGVGATSEQKAALDELHKRKIDLADRVHVLNVGGYIGDSTRSEIEYAEKAGKPITYLDPEAARAALIEQHQYDELIFGGFICTHCTPDDCDDPDDNVYYPCPSLRAVGVTDDDAIGIIKAHRAEVEARARAGAR